MEDTTRLTRWNPNLHPRGWGGRFVSSNRWPNSSSIEPTPDQSDLWDKVRQFPRGTYSPTRADRSNAQLKQDWAETLDGLSYSRRQKEAIRRYQDESVSESINQELRNGNLHPYHGEVIAQLDAAAAHSQTRRDAVVYRGVASLPVQPGDVITDHGFMSTSLNPSVAQGFNYGSNSNSVIQIEVPAGSNAISPLIDPSNLEFQEELELILPRGTQLEVLSVTPDAIRARLLPK